MSLSAPCRAVVLGLLAFCAYVTVPQTQAQLIPPFLDQPLLPTILDPILGDVINIPTSPLCDVTDPLLVDALQLFTLCQVINGDVILNGVTGELPDFVTSIVTGDVTVSNTSAANIDSLSNLSVIGGNLNIIGNDNLTSIDLNNLASVGLDVIVKDNPLLEGLNIPLVSALIPNLTIINNPSLTQVLGGVGSRIPGAPNFLCPVDRLVGNLLISLNPLLCCNDLFLNVDLDNVGDTAVQTDCCVSCDSCLESNDWGDRCGEPAPCEGEGCVPDDDEGKYLIREVHSFIRAPSVVHACSPLELDATFSYAETTADSDREPVLMYSFFANGLNVLSRPFDPENNDDNEIIESPDAPEGAINLGRFANPEGSKIKISAWELVAGDSYEFTVEVAATSMDLSTVYTDVSEPTTSTIRSNINEQQVPAILIRPSRTAVCEDQKVRLTPDIEYPEIFELCAQGAVDGPAPSNDNSDGSANPQEPASSSTGAAGADAESSTAAAGEGESESETETAPSNADSSSTGVSSDGASSTGSSSTGSSSTGGARRRLLQATSSSSSSSSTGAAGTDSTGTDSTGTDSTGTDSTSTDSTGAASSSTGSSGSEDNTDGEVEEDVNSGAPVPTVVFRPRLSFDWTVKAFVGKGAQKFDVTSTVVPEPRFLSAAELSVDSLVAGVTYEFTLTTDVDYNPNFSERYDVPATFSVSVDEEELNIFILGQNKLIARNAPHTLETTSTEYTARNQRELAELTGLPQTVVAPLAVRPVQEFIWTCQQRTFEGEVVDTDDKCNLGDVIVDFNQANLNIPAGALEDGEFVFQVTTAFSNSTQDFSIDQAVLISEPEKFALPEINIFTPECSKISAGGILSINATAEHSAAASPQQQDEDLVLRWSLWQEDVQADGAVIRREIDLANFPGLLSQDIEDVTELDIETFIPSLNDKPIEEVEEDESTHQDLKPGFAYVFRLNAWEVFATDEPATNEPQPDGAAPAESSSTGSAGPSESSTGSAESSSTGVDGAESESSTGVDGAESESSTGVDAAGESSTGSDSSSSSTGSASRRLLQEGEGETEEAETSKRITFLSGGQPFFVDVPEGVDEDTYSYSELRLPINQVPQVVPEKVTVTPVVGFALETKFEVSVKHKDGNAPVQYRYGYRQRGQTEAEITYVTDLQADVEAMILLPEGDIIVSVDVVDSLGAKVTYSLEDVEVIVNSARQQGETDDCRISRQVNAITGDVTFAEKITVATSIARELTTLAPTDVSCIGGLNYASVLSSIVAQVSGEVPEGSKLTLTQAYQLVEFSELIISIPTVSSFEIDQVVRVVQLISNAFPSLTTEQKQRCSCKPETLPKDLSDRIIDILDTIFGNGLNGLSCESARAAALTLTNVMKSKLLELSYVTGQFNEFSDNFVRSAELRKLISAARFFGKKFLPERAIDSSISTFVVPTSADYPNEITVTVSPPEGVVAEGLELYATIVNIAPEFRACYNGPVVGELVAISAFYQNGGEEIPVNAETIVAIDSDWKQKEKAYDFSSVNGNNQDDRYGKPVGTVARRRLLQQQEDEVPTADSTLYCAGWDEGLLQWRTDDCSVISRVSSAQNRDGSTSPAVQCQCAPNPDGSPRAVSVLSVPQNGTTSGDEIRDPDNVIVPCEQTNEIWYPVIGLLYLVLAFVAVTRFASVTQFFTRWKASFWWLFFGFATIATACVIRAIHAFFYYFQECDSDGRISLTWSEVILLAYIPTLMLFLTIPLLLRSLQHRYRRDLVRSFRFVNGKANGDHLADNEFDEEYDNEFYEADLPGRPWRAEASDRKEIQDKRRQYGDDIPLLPEVKLPFLTVGHSRFFSFTALVLFALTGLGLVAKYVSEFLFDLVYWVIAPLAIMGVVTFFAFPVFYRRVSYRLRDLVMNRHSRRGRLAWAFFCIFFLVTIAIFLTVLLLDLVIDEPESQSSDSGTATTNSMHFRLFAVEPTEGAALSGSSNIVQDFHAYHVTFFLVDVVAFALATYILWPHYQFDPHYTLTTEQDPEKGRAYTHSTSSSIESRGTDWSDGQWPPKRRASLANDNEESQFSDGSDGSDEYRFAASNQEDDSNRMAPISDDEIQMSSYKKGPAEENQGQSNAYHNNSSTTTTTHTTVRVYEQNDRNLRQYPEDNSGPMAAELARSRFDAMLVKENEEKEREAREEREREEARRLREERERDEKYRREQQEAREREERERRSREEENLRLQREIELARKQAEEDKRAAEEARRRRESEERREAADRAERQRREREAAEAREVEERKRREEDEKLRIAAAAAKRAADEAIRRREHEEQQAREAELKRKEEEERARRERQERQEREERERQERVRREREEYERQQRELEEQRLRERREREEFERRERERQQRERREREERERRERMERERVERERVEREERERREREEYERQQRVVTTKTVTTSSSAQRSYRRQSVIANTAGKVFYRPERVIKTEGFNLDKCCKYVLSQLRNRKSLKELGMRESEVKEIVDKIREQWILVDMDESGLVSQTELRIAIWTYEPENAGVPMPAGDLPRDLQDVFDEILSSVDWVRKFDFWQFTSAFLNDHLSLDVTFPVPGHRWAQADESMDD